MKKYLPLLFIYVLFGLKVTAQCNAAFSYTINKDSVSFIPADTSSDQEGYWYFYDSGDNFYGWDNSDTTFSLTSFNPGTYTIHHYVYKETNGYCMDSAWETITIKYTPTCSATISYVKDSFTNAYIFNAKPIYDGGGVPNSTWTLDGTNNPDLYSYYNSLRDTLSAGAHQICYDITTAAGCTSSTCQTITVQPPQNCGWQASFTETASSTNPHLINFNALPNQPNLIYHWDFGDQYNYYIDSAQASTVNPSHTYAYAGTYSVKVIIADTQTGCSQLDSAHITVLPTPSESCITSFTYTLSKGNASFTAMSNQTITSENWTIYPPYNAIGQNTVNLRSFNPVYNFPDTGYYYIYFSDSTNTGCVGSYYAQVYVDSITGNSRDTSVVPVCNAAFTYAINQDSVSFTPADSSSNLSETWGFYDNNNSFFNLSNSNYTFTLAFTPGTYMVQHIIYNATNGCTDTVSQNIAVTYIPVCNAAFTYTINQDSVSFTPVDSLPIDDTWNFFDSNNNLYYGKGSFNTFTLAFNPGTYTAQHILYNPANGCTDTVSQSITVTYIPPCNAQFTFAVNKDSVSFMPADSSANLYQYWYFYDSSNNYYDSYYSDNSFTLTSFNPGIYTVEHTVYNPATGCSDSASHIIAINYTPTCSATVSYNKDQFSNMYTFNANQVYDGNGIQSSVWTVDGIPDSMYDWSYLQDNLVLPGAHQVCYNMTTGAGCRASACQTVTVPAAQNCGWQASFTAIASSTDTHLINFSASPNQSNLSYHWDFGDQYNYYGDSVESDIANPSYTYAYTGTYSVKIIITDTLTGCFQIDSASVTVQPSPSESCTSSFTWLLNAGQATFTATSNQTIVAENWTIEPLDSLNQSITLNTIDPIYNFADTGYYYTCLSVSTSTGCNSNSCQYMYVGSIGNNPDSSVLQCYPNPATGNTVNVALILPGAALVQYNVSNIYGNVVYQYQLQGLAGNNVITIPLQTLADGQYFIDIIYNNQHYHSVFQKLN